MELHHIARRAGRLSSFLRGELGLSAGLVNRLKWKAGLLVNGSPEHTDYPVHPGDRITVLLDDPAPSYPAQDLPLSIVYEDEDLLAVDKPAGMLVHPSRHRNTDTLANGVLGYYRRTGQACAFHPATRLDRDTFGLVLLGKNAHVHRLLNELHAAGELKKTYHGLVFGTPDLDDGLIDAPIARLPLPSLLRQVRPDGQPARTEYRVLERGPDWSLLELRPLTGRTHQLRVHCAYLGFPILGDPQYGTAASLARSAALGLQGQMLCARRLELPHPRTGRPLTLVSHMEVGLPGAPYNPRMD